MSNSEPAPKKQRTEPSYTILYHAGIPGRGEYIRLALEAAGVAYSDAGNESARGRKSVYEACSSTSMGDESGNPPPFCPPMLRVSGAGRNGGALLLSQTPNILQYVGAAHGLAGADDIDRLHIHALALTALDLSNEAHDTHHPVAVRLPYEDQMPEARRKAADFRAHRIPKFLGYFERVLRANADNGNGNGRYLVGDALSYADTTLWQVVDGLRFAFPNELEAREKEFPTVLGSFYDGVRDEEGVKAYLESGRRLEYSMGLYRRYPELDRE